MGAKMMKMYLVSYAAEGDRSQTDGGFVSGISTIHTTDQWTRPATPYIYFCIDVEVLNPVH